MSGQRIIDAINQNIKDKKTFFSFEYFPPKTEKGVENLYERLERMSLCGPTWIDVTWGAGGSTSTLTLDICGNAQKFIGLETMMHMTCTNMPREGIKKALEEAKDKGIRNILALRGDPPRGEEWKKVEGGFEHAVDLVRFIRQEYGDYFGICVAGYPEAHIDATSYEDDMKYLKEKVDAGADFIITQLFYDVDRFLKFVADCRSMGINCPIVPGIMPIHTFAGFDRMTTLCKTAVPQKIKDALEPIKNDDEAVKTYGVQLGIDMCKTLLEAGTPCLHFYTLNLEKSVISILQGLNLIDQEIRKPFPWLTTPTRAKESVRPIFWIHRPRSYMHRTASWDEFPNGRWGDSRSPAFGDLTDFHISDLHAAKTFDKKVWGASPTTEQEIYDVFVKYCNKDIERLPWCETPLTVESDSIKSELLNINRHGFLTINSQPAVNGAPSTDPLHGWGPKGGYVYQKAYVEFFVSPKNFQVLVDTIKQYFPSITYFAVNIKGEFTANYAAQVTAVTWGVFPGHEILQPTVVDPDSFNVWKDEAYALWKTNWASIYADGSDSRKLLDTIINSYYLVSMVDNNFVNGDIFAVFKKAIEAANQ